MISGTLRHEGAVVAEVQEPLARAFGQVEHQAIVPPGIRMGDCRPGEPPVCGPPAPRPASRAAELRTAAAWDSPSSSPPAAAVRGLGPRGRARHATGRSGAGRGGESDHVAAERGGSMR